MKRDRVSALRRAGAGLLALLMLPFVVDEGRAQDPQTGSTVATSVVRGYILDHDTGGPIAGATVLLGAGPRGTAAAGSRQIPSVDPVPDARTAARVPAPRRRGPPEGGPP